jgi:hypothetical protein
MSLRGRRRGGGIPLAFGRVACRRSVRALAVCGAWFGHRGKSPHPRLSCVLPCGAYTPRGQDGPRTNDRECGDCPLILIRRASVPPVAGWAPWLGICCCRRIAPTTTNSPNARHGGAPGSRVGCHVDRVYGGQRDTQLTSGSPSPSMTATHGEVDERGAGGSRRSFVLPRNRNVRRAERNARQTCETFGASVPAADVLPSVQATHAGATAGEPRCAPTIHPAKPSTGVSPAPAPSPSG